MSSSPELVGGGVLRGTAAAAAAPARIDADLRRSPYAQRYGADPRLVNPRLEQAFADVAARVREAARAEGYAAGWAEGQRAATAEVRAEAERAAAAAAEVQARQAEAFAAALATLDRAAADLEGRVAATAAQAEDALTRAAFTLTESLLGRELALASDPGLDAVRRALALAPHGRPVTVRLNPDDHAPVATLPTGVLGRDVTLVADPAVEPGGAIVDCDATRIDARLGPALERVREVLAP